MRLFRSLAAAAVAALLIVLPGEVQAQMSAPGGSATDAEPASEPAGRGGIAWRIDANHSDITFRVRHLVTRVAGTFDRWTVALDADPADWAGGSVIVNIEAASINTRHERRDTHLRSDDFFDAANHPAITFQSRRITAEGDRLRIDGDLTIRGVTKPVTLDGEIIALMSAPDGTRRVGFHATTRIDRHDFGVSWNRAAEGGGLVLANDVDIEINLAAVGRPE